MSRPRTGLLVFSESLVREDVYQKRKKLAATETARFISIISEFTDVVASDIDEIRSKKQGIDALQQIEKSNVDAIILYVPIFIAPALVAHIANLATRPIVLAQNENEASLSQLAFLAVAGILDQIGLSYLRLGGDVVDDDVRNRLKCFITAASVHNRLKGKTFGAIGGRSLGINTGVADSILWQRLFNIDIEHIDQSEIIRKSGLQDNHLIDKYVSWYEKNAHETDYNDTNFTPKHLRKQIASYLATKEIIAEHELDFIGIKCQTELSNHHCLQCVNISLCNDPYDADGAKEPVCASCETDADGALSMEVLKLLSGTPASLNDLASVSGNEIVMANCGSMASYFAGFSDDYRENLSRVNLVPHSFGEAGGCATAFIVPAGNQMTCMRLFRIRDRYALGLLTGVTFERSYDQISPNLHTRPLIFLKTNLNKQLFLETFGSNHILAVRGYYKDELRAFADLLGLSFYDYDLE